MENKYLYDFIISLKAFRKYRKEGHFVQNKNDQKNLYLRIYTRLDRFSKK